LGLPLVAPNFQRPLAAKLYHTRTKLRVLEQYAVVDSVGFRRRTEQTELILAPVLSANISVIVTGPLVNIVVNGFLIMDS